MNQEPLTLTLQDLEPILTKSNCSCHFINPNKTRIILWKEVKENTVTYYLRIGIQKFISYPLTDKNQAIYWRFNDLVKIPIEQAKASQENHESDAVTKFQSRPTQTTSHPE